MAREKKTVDKYAGPSDGDDDRLDTRNEKNGFLSIARVEPEGRQGPYAAQRGLHASSSTNVLINGWSSESKKADMGGAERGHDYNFGRGLEGGSPRLKIRARAAEGDGAGCGGETEVEPVERMVEERDQHCSKRHRTANGKQGDEEFERDVASVHPLAEDARSGFEKATSRTFWNDDRGMDRSDFVDLGSPKSRFERSKVVPSNMMHRVKVKKGGDNGRDGAHGEGEAANGDFGQSMLGEGSTNQELGLGGIRFEDDDAPYWDSWMEKRNEASNPTILSAPKSHSVSPELGVERLRIGGNIMPGQTENVLSEAASDCNTVLRLFSERDNSETFIQRNKMSPGIFGRSEGRTSQSLSSVREVEELPKLNGVLDLSSPTSFSLFGKSADRTPNASQFRPTNRSAVSAARNIRSNRGYLAVNGDPIEVPNRVEENRDSSNIAVRPCGEENCLPDVDFASLLPLQRPRNARQRRRSQEEDASGSMHLGLNSDTIREGNTLAKDKPSSDTHSVPARDSDQRSVSNWRSRLVELISLTDEEADNAEHSIHANGTPSAMAQPPNSSLRQDLLWSDQANEAVRPSSMMDRDLRSAGQEQTVAEADSLPDNIRLLGSSLFDDLWFDPVRETGQPGSRPVNRVSQPGGKERASVSEIDGGQGPTSNSVLPSLRPSLFRNSRGLDQPNGALRRLRNPDVSMEGGENSEERVGERQENAQSNILPSTNMQPPLLTSFQELWRSDESNEGSRPRRFMDFIAPRRERDEAGRAREEADFQRGRQAESSFTQLPDSFWSGYDWGSEPENEANDRRNRLMNLFSRVMPNDESADARDGALADTAPSADSGASNSRFFRDVRDSNPANGAGNSRSSLVDFISRRMARDEAAAAVQETHGNVDAVEVGSSAGGAGIWGIGGEQPNRAGFLRQCPISLDNGLEREGAGVTSQRRTNGWIRFGGGRVASGQESEEAREREIGRPVRSSASGLSLARDTWMLGSNSDNHVNRGNAETASPKELLTEMSKQEGRRRQRATSTLRGYRRARPLSDVQVVELGDDEDEGRMNVEELGNATLSSVAGVIEEPPADRDTQLASDEKLALELQAALDAEDQRLAEQVDGESMQADAELARTLQVEENARAFRRRGHVQSREGSHRAGTGEQEWDTYLSLTSQSPSRLFHAPRENHSDSSVFHRRLPSHISSDNVQSRNDGTLRAFRDIEISSAVEEEAGARSPGQSVGVLEDRAERVFGDGRRVGALWPERAGIEIAETNDTLPLGFRGRAERFLNPGFMTTRDLRGREAFFGVRGDGNGEEGEGGGGTAEDEGRERDATNGGGGIRERLNGARGASERLRRNERARERRERRMWMGGVGPDLDDTLFGRRRMSFSQTMSSDQRVEFLASLEAALSRELPLALRLATVDRDFNEDDYEMLLRLDEIGLEPSRRGASSANINQLPTTTVTDIDVFEEPCSICLEEPKVGEVLRRLPCVHIFHRQCIDDWLRRQAVCPICKREISRT